MEHHWLTSDQFKAQVKIGDVVINKANDRVRVTAIGEARFLFRPLAERINTSEGVSVLGNHVTKWRKENDHDLVKGQPAIQAISKAWNEDATNETKLPCGSDSNR